MLSCYSTSSLGSLPVGSWHGSNCIYLFGAWHLHLFLKGQKGETCGFFKIPDNRRVLYVPSCFSVTSNRLKSKTLPARYFLEPTSRNACFLSAVGWHFVFKKRLGNEIKHFVLLHRKLARMKGQLSGAEQERQLGGGSVKEHSPPQFFCHAQMNLNILLLD